MKNLFRNIALAALSLLVLVSCKEQESENLDPASIFNLSSKWETPDGTKIHLEDLKGKVLTMVMIYT
ncbi:MAG: SCO family protein, partial [Chryseobacterium sp.]|nr:SCO family protein [Chryseobacterium sp.]